jgi:hypothetical protein
MQMMFLAVALVSLSCSVALAGAEGSDQERGNILFVIIDDAGIDQFRAFNSGAIDTQLAQTPVIDAIFDSSVRFTNCWSMPECSPSRTCYFTGRYPLRTGVMAACLPTDTPRSQCSPYETTAPDLFKANGYDQAYFGKLHIGDPTLNPAGDALSWDLGMPHFDGTPYGAPAFIDYTLFGQMPDQTSDQPVYSCGLPIDPLTNAQAICSCAFADGTWSDGLGAVDCLSAGGVPLVESDGTPITVGSAEALARVDFESAAGNGYYVMSRAVVTSPVAEVSLQRGYSTRLEADRTIDWINSHDGDAPWFVSLGFTGIHTPYQQSPNDLLPEGAEWPKGLTQRCGAQAGIDSPPGPAQRQLANQMLEAIDTELERVLLETGIASMVEGKLEMLDPSVTIILIGDNGTYFPIVRFPFNPLQAKATVYQTGVSVPLAVAGNRVIEPDRDVDALVNCVDIFSLLSELGGIDYEAQVPARRTLDCKPMLPFLENTDQAGFREYNFTQYDENVHIKTANIRPCLLNGIMLCTDTILFNEDVCAAQGGTWFPTYDTCCDVLEGDKGLDFDILPKAQWAVTNGRWKLVRSSIESCIGGNPDQFYDLENCPFADILGGRGIDNDSADLLASDKPLTREQQENYDALVDALDAINSSEISCPGDVTLDKRVDGADLGAVLHWWGEHSSVCDFNDDGYTDGADLAVILANWNPDCSG